MAQSNVMSAKDNGCRKFQANIFNKSKCQNCFKARDAHLLSDEDFTQAKPIYGGWLLLAPEGTNFDNPLHRTRKWQRRFFLLYEHGLLRYALDDMASTLPQGTINLNQCVDVVDGESRTGQKHSLCICTPEKDHYIRAESKETIHGWQEALMVFPRTNKQNQKKKRKVETPTPQAADLLSGRCSQQNINGFIEPGPAKVTVTSTSSSSSMVCLPSTIAHAERVPSTRATLWQEETWSRATLPTSCSTGSLSQLDSGNASVGRKPRVESGYFSLEKSKPEEDEERQHHRQQKQEPSPPTQQQHLLSSSSTTSSSSSRSRYLSFDHKLFSSPISSHKRTSHDPHSAASTQTYGIAHNSCAHKHNTQRLSISEEHVLALDSPPSSDATLCPLPSPDRLSSPNSHANILPSSLSSSQSSLDSEQGPESCVGGASGRAGRGGQGYVALADVPRARRLSHRDAYRSSQKRQELRARTRSPGREEVERLFGRERSRRSQVIERFECHDTVSTPEQMDTTNSSTDPAPSYSKTANQRAGRNERRLSNQKQEFSLDSAKDRTDDVSSLAGYRRAKSLDRRSTETLMTPDLLNFKKGWMTKLYEDGLWKKHWFVLTDQSLRFYRDSIAEEAADLDGEIDLSACYDVTEFQVQRNYGFQILSKEGAFTLSAMTSGIRRNWIQAILKNMRPTVAPDVTRKNVSLKLSVLMPSSLPEERTRSNVEQNYIQPPSNSSQLSNSSVVESKKLHEDITDSAPTSDHRKSRVNKREGRSKTFDWSEFRPGQENEIGPPSIKRADTSVIISSSASSTSSGDSSPISSTSSHQTSSSITTTSHTDKLPQQDEEVMQEYMHRNQSAPTADTVNATTVAEPPSKLPHKVPHEQVRMDVDHARDAQEVDSQSTARRNSDVQVEIEQRWHQVETTPLREEKQVPITGSSNVPVGERALPQELTTTLEKELGQAQRELARLQQQNSILQEQLQDARGREQSAREGYVLQATCERGFAAMEETHQKVIEDIQRQHQREIRKLLEEKERLLEEETNATIAAIEAMKNAHREELEKTQRSQMSGVSADIQELRRQYEEELQSIHRELEVLSEQYSQKCLENAHLAQALEAERQALGQCQRENQKLHIHNQELNHRLNEEITRMHSCISEDKSTSSLTQGKDIYELEVLLRVKESEIQYLKQEINSLKDELQSALRDRKYASDKYKDIYTELSIVKAKADCDINKLREKLLAATEALGELDAEGSGVTPGYDIMKSKSNPDFLKKEKSKQMRGVRSKAESEGLFWDS
ncbi:myosin phosphatase Rho-interacting protein-like isoform X12 [Cyprinus carpio]|uniref:Myosin phosphatase Rho-interacting protein-like isoform X12 n=1 Tax=Cyprinus carpio TaxID=7962 RepID=A0A9Q9ZL75_CYPCA|nr:myosin phosphatase Rho-interacting protein-like isoform X12 [Cyprinus carpio]XP_018976633.1 myosin phosphatase Rho-interacting protein-like isoform X12 [Cyprinus carpio]